MEILAIENLSWKKSCGFDIAPGTENFQNLNFKVNFHYEDIFCCLSNANFKNYAQFL